MAATDHDKKSKRGSDEHGKKLSAKDKKSSGGWRERLANLIPSSPSHNADIISKPTEVSAKNPTLRNMLPAGFWCRTTIIGDDLSNSKGSYKTQLFTTICSLYDQGKRHVSPNTECFDVPMLNEKNTLTKIQLKDTTGIPENQYFPLDIVILVFSVHSLASFANISAKWLPFLKSNNNGNYGDYVLVGVRDAEADTDDEQNNYNNNSSIQVPAEKAQGFTASQASIQGYFEVSLPHTNDNNAAIQKIMQTVGSIWTNKRRSSVLPKPSATASSPPHSGSGSGRHMSLPLPFLSTAEQDLVNWLAKIDLLQLKEILIDKEKCDIYTVQNLSEQDMREIGITQFGIRKKLINEIEKLKRVQKKVVEDENLLLTDVVIGEAIGAGAGGSVFKGKLNGDTDVACKKLHSGSAEAIETKLFYQEAQILTSLRHPNILLFLGIYIDKKSEDTSDYYLVTELMDQDLSHALRDEIEYREGPAIMRMIKQIASAMKHLELKNIVHRDLAARNILLDKHGNLKLADFGLARRLVDEYYSTNTATSTKPRLPFRSIAPEARVHKRFSVKSDVWSFGVLIWEIIEAGAVPYGDMDAATLARELENGYRLKVIRQDCPSTLIELMNKCWHIDPHQRPSFFTIFEEMKKIHWGDEPPEEEELSLIDDYYLREDEDDEESSTTSNNNSNNNNNNNYNNNNNNNNSNYQHNPRGAVYREDDRLYSGVRTNNSFSPIRASADDPSLNYNTDLPPSKEGVEEEDDSSSSSSSNSNSNSPRSKTTWRTKKLTGAAKKNEREEEELSYS